MDETLDAAHPNDAFAQLGKLIMAWFRIRPLWVTQGARKLPAYGGRILVG